MLLRFWNAANVWVAVFLLVSLLVSVRYLLIPHESLSFVAGYPRAFTSTKLPFWSRKYARQAWTRLRPSRLRLAS